MAGIVLHDGCTVLCPHGGSVTRASSTALDDIWRQSDVYVVAGCPFAVWGSASPCVSISFWVGVSKTLSKGSPMILHNSLGGCASAAGTPQGMAVVVSFSPGAEQVD